jgi:hypothetical protein
MKLADYEREGGFRDELHNVRVIGEHVTSLKDAFYVRGPRPAERDALNKLAAALEELRAEIVKTRGK